MTKGEQVVKIALGEVGVVESPRGANRGGRVQQYQSATELGGTGWPWCAAFVEWCWKRAGGIDTSTCSPSTAVFAQRARAKKQTGRCRPGAAVCWAPKHVEIAVAPTSNPNIWHCVGGNVDDGVRRTVRDIRGATIIVPPQLSKTPPRPRLYWLEDRAARKSQRVLGPWRGPAGLAYARKVAASRRKKGMPARVKRIGPGQRFAVLTGDRVIYGPWQDSSGRDRARKILQRRLGRTIRPYSTLRPLTGASAQSFGKTT